VALDWNTPRTDLATALLSLALTPSAPGYIVGAARLGELDAIGAAYDADAARLATEISAENSAYSAAVTSWSAVIDAPWSNLDLACRYIELRQYLAQHGRRVAPRRITNDLGARVVLSGNTYTLPMSGGDVTEEVLSDTTSRAELTLSTGGGVPILRVRALADGYEGRFTSATVGNASDGIATHFKVSLTRGVTPDLYTEVYDNLDCSAAAGTLGSQDESLLALPFEQVGVGRPTNGGPTALVGGTGGLYDAAIDRVTRLRALQSVDDDVLAVTAEDVALLDEARAQFEGAWGQRPAKRNPIANRETELQAAIDAAVSITRYLTTGLP